MQDKLGNKFTLKIIYGNAVSSTTPLITDLVEAIIKIGLQLLQTGILHSKFDFNFKSFI